MMEIFVIEMFHDHLGWTQAPTINLKTHSEDCISHHRMVTKDKLELYKKKYPDADFRIQKYRRIEDKEQPGKSV